MSNILSNRFFQGGIAIAAIAIGFFVYQGFSTEDTEENAINTIETPASSIETVGTTATNTSPEDNGTEAIDAEVENAVNTETESDNINSAVDEATNTK